MPKILNQSEDFFLNKWFPTCCVFCNKRQEHSICNSCFLGLGLDKPLKACTICGKPNHTWVCKVCLNQRWAFDQTIFIAHESNRLFSIVQSCNRGRLNHLHPLLQAWEISCKKKMIPMDFMVPFPENLINMQSRGFWFALELAKGFQKINRIPIKIDCLDLIPDQGAWSSFRIGQNDQKNQSLQNLRLAIVLPYMEFSYPVQEFSLYLKKLGARWISNWVLIRNSKKEQY
jgi:predicted amidophosphoribosyltransferase